MKGHATKQDLVGLLQGRFNARKKALIENHLAACPACDATYGILKKTVAPTPAKNLKPARAVQTRVMAFHDRHAAGPRVPEQSKSPILADRRFRYAAACAAAACACILAVLLLHPQYETAPIHAARVSGNVSADRSLLLKGQQIRPGVLLTTGENSKFAIMHGKIMKLIAGPHTRIAITKSRIDKKTGKVYFEMVIDKGSIIAVFDKAGNLQYTLITPHGKVSSSGSRIALKVDPSKTRVMVKNGSANISSRGRTVNTEEGSGYSITSNEITSAMEPSDENEDDNSTLYDKTVNELLDGDDEDVVID